MDDYLPKPIDARRCARPSRAHAASRSGGAGRPLRVDEAGRDRHADQTGSGRQRGAASRHATLRRRAGAGMNENLSAASAKPWIIRRRAALRPHPEDHQEVRRLHRRRRRQPRHLQGRAVLPARRLGLRQVDPAAHARRLRDADRGPDRDRRRRTWPACPPYERPTNMMFQSYALFPHMTVEKNVAYGLRRDGMGKAEAMERVADMLRHGPARRASPSASRTSCRAASASAWRWRAASSSARSCCCSTSRSARSTRSCARRPSSS